MALEHLVLAGLAGIVAGLGLAGLMLARLVRATKPAEIARVPLAVGDAIVAVPGAGVVDVAFEGPRFSSAFRRVTLELTDTTTATAIPLRRRWMRSHTTHAGRSRVSVYRATLPRGGTCRLQIGGVDAAHDECAILLLAPNGAPVVTTVVAMIAAMLLAAASFAVVGALTFRQAPPATNPGDASSVDAPRPADVTAHGGRALASDPRRLTDTREIAWPLLRMRVRVPTTWEPRPVGNQQVDVRHATTPSTYFLARASAMPAGPNASDYFASHVEHARAQLADGRIAGFATRRLGAIHGVVTIEQRAGDGPWVVTWTGFETAELGSIAVTIMLGATRADFAQDETLLGAILDDVRFE